jgi:hypothetical protein
MMHRGATPTEADELHLVLIENGAPFAVHAQPNQRVVVAIAQTADERPVDFALRAIERIARLERKGRWAAEVTLAVGQNDGDSLLATRALVARALLQHLMNTRESVLVLHADRGANDGSRHELMALAGTLTTELVGSSVMVRVRFTESERDDQSGVRWTRPEPAQPVALAERVMAS